MQVVPEGHVEDKDGMEESEVGTRVSVVMQAKIRPKVGVRFSHIKRHTMTIPLRHAHIYILTSINLPV